jgi:hypothetical protein
MVVELEKPNLAKSRSGKIVFIPIAVESWETAGSVTGFVRLPGSFTHARRKSDCRIAPVL